MGGDIGTGAPHATTVDECLLESSQSGDDHVAIRFPTASLAFVDPLGGGEMTALTVASFAGRYLVLDDARSAFDPRDEVFGRGLDQSNVDRSTTPHAFGAVPTENDRHAFPSIEFATRFTHPRISSRRVGVTPLDRRECGRAHTGSGSNGMSLGRFAPSPTGVLHVGNLRTAVVAWLAAESSGGRMLVRVEDLDRANSSRENEIRQLADLRRIGLTFPDEIRRQSDRFPSYDSVISDLTARGLTYRCFCTRKEIREAASAPNGPMVEGAYPGTCRHLSGREIDERLDEGRPFAVRLRTDGESYTFDDRILGPVTGMVDDFVLRRNDGVPAYNLAVVVDDAEQGVDQIVRGDDLALSTPRHLHLQQILGHRSPEYAHVPLVLGGDGERLAKRHGAVTLDDLTARDEDDRSVVAVLLASLGLPPDLVAARHEFAWGRITRKPWTIPDHWQTRTS